MRLVTVVINASGFDVKQVGAKNSNKYIFQAMETDLNGARIPCEIQTFSEDIKNVLREIPEGSEILIPFSQFSFYANKNQYSVDSLILHKNFEILNPMAH